MGERSSPLRSHSDEEVLSLDALRQADLLDGAPEAAFDRLTKLVSRFLQVPTSLVSLADADRQFFKSSVGRSDPLASRRETSLSHSFCKYVTSMQQPLVVENAREHPLVRNSPAIDDYDAIAYLGVPIHTPDGHVIGTLCAIDHKPRQWTEQDRETLEQLAESANAEIALRAAMRAADETNRAKTEFLASMSHEIRTPLNGVIGYTDLLLDQALKPEQRRLAERIQFAGAALLTVVNDILDFSKIEAGQVELHPRPFSLESLIRNTVSIVSELAERKGLALEVELGPDLPKGFIGDEARIRQILLNLLNNAIKFTQEGQVRLQVECDGSSPECKRLRFSVSDTGIGITEDQRKHLFHRFYQVNQSSTRQYGGTGLGLAISKRLAQLMGGEIGLESQEGYGSTFWITLPRRRAEDTIVAQEYAAASTAQASHSGRILLVEDLEHNRDLARAILAKAGHEVDTAENGAEAVEAVQARSYDLVLMDIQMPVMDGITATQKIREMEGPASQVPIVAMTANVLPHQVTAFAEAGMNDHIGKPFKKAELFQKVNAWLERARMEGQPPSGSEEQAGSTGLDELREMMGDEWVERGLRKLRQQIEETFGDEAAALADRQELARRAHQLVSHAALLGLMELSRLCSKLEEACKSGKDLPGRYQKARDAARIACPSPALRRQAGAFSERRTSGPS